jgi:hypothetical protein
MMKYAASGALIALGLLLATTPAVAHHSFAAEFDIEKQVTLKGVITKVEWVNPHVYVYLDAKDESGKITGWSLESLSTAAIRRGGVTRNMLGLGQTVNVLAYRAKDGSNFAFLRKITFPDGHVVEIFLGDANAVPQ